MLAVSFLFVLSLSAVEVEIDGINYELIAKAKQAKVIAKYYSGAVVIPESVKYKGVSYAVTSIGDYAFQYCSGLTSVTIPNSVTSIGDYAFQYCRDLTSVTIPNSVTSIGEDAFIYCESLKEVHISDIAAWCNIVFSNANQDFLGNANYSNPLYYAHRLFLDDEEVTDLVIPEGVTVITDYLFSNCRGLTSVTIPNSVTSIGERAFYDCTFLTSVTIPNSVTSIGDYAFFRCRGLTSVTIPNSVKSIGDYAFGDCYYLTSVTIGNSVKSIGERAFYSCNRLTSVTIGNSVKSIGERAFESCESLKEVHISDIVAWCDLKFGTSDSNPLYYAHRLFLGDKEVKDLVIPDGVFIIRSYAFSGCSGLTSVIIPNSTLWIGESAFSDCSDLTDVYCFAEKVPPTESDVFVGSYVEYATLHVPTAAMEDYKANAPWSSFGKIVALTEEETGIENIEAENANSNDAPVYNINGMKMQDVDNLPKGIYIKGGKKFVIK